MQPLVWQVPFVLISSIIWLKQTLLWLYIWQRKEYRIDKMRDYLTLPESKPILWEKWTLFRLGFAAIWCATFGINLWLTKIEFVTNLLAWLWLLVAVLEVAEFTLKLIIRRTTLKPTFSAKATLNFGLTFLTFQSILLYAAIFDPIFKASLVSAVLVLIIPLLIGIWLGIFSPLDRYFKQKLFQKALIHRKNLIDLKVIAISGAYGKTTTKEVLGQLLESKFVVEKTLKNQNTGVAVARKTLKLNEQTNFFVSELGAYKIGEGSEICEFTLPTTSIITGLNYQHFSLFGSEQNIIKAETESLQFLPPNATVAVNWSSQMCHKIDFPETIKLIKYGIPESETEAQEYDFYAQNLQLNSDLQTQFDLVYKVGNIQTKHQLQTNLLSKGNIENLVGALSLAINFGLKIEEIKPLLKTLNPPQGSLEISQQDENILINDSYNANFDGVVNAIKLLYQIKQVKNNPQKPNLSVLFLDDILELGTKSTEIHIQLAKIINQNPPDITVLLGRNFSEIVQNELVKNGYDENQILNFKLLTATQIREIITKKSSDKAKITLLEGFGSKKFV